MITRSPFGLVLAGIYLLFTIFLFATQGIFGESFIALILGLPWSLIFVSFEYGNASGALLYVMVLAPIIFNALLLYGIGMLLEKMRYKHILFGIVVVLLLLVGGFFAFNGYIYQEKQADPNEEIASYRGTLSGEVVCLPHRDTEGPQTLECVMGLQTDTDEYYALDFSMASQMNPGIDHGNRMRANGLITPVEMLSSDRWQKYAIEGIFSVTDSIEKL
jgi:hypothetical protein